MKCICVIGAGPAGLTAADILSENSYDVVVLEKSKYVGGLCKTVKKNDFYFDVGPHRYYAKSEMVNTYWHKIIGDDFIPCQRASKIYFSGKLRDYPLVPTKNIGDIGFLDFAKGIASFLSGRFLFNKKSDNFEDWLIGKYGLFFYKKFYSPYMKKVWSTSCSKLSSEVAKAQHMEDISLYDYIKGYFNNHTNEVVNMVNNDFLYPKYDSGYIWDLLLEKIKSRITLNKNVQLNYISAVDDRYEVEYQSNNEAKRGLMSKIHS